MLWETPRAALFHDAGPAKAPTLVKDAILPSSNGTAERSSCPESIASVRRLRTADPGGLTRRAHQAGSSAVLPTPLRAAAPSCSQRASWLLPRSTGRCFQRLPPGEHGSKVLEEQFCLSQQGATEKTSNTILDRGWKKPAMRRETMGCTSVR